MSEWQNRAERPFLKAASTAQSTTQQAAQRFFVLAEKARDKSWPGHALTVCRMGA
jgi:hypothetical protein